MEKQRPIGIVRPYNPEDDRPPKMSTCEEGEVTPLPATVRPPWASEGRGARLLRLRALYAPSSPPGRLQRETPPQGPPSLGRGRGLRDHLEAAVARFSQTPPPGYSSRQEDRSPRGETVLNDEEN